ncbi:RNA degradosome polyphosphate kinase [Clostridium sp. OM05-6BH]|jgi:polyphosphate kinase|uniref:RNA degradosome polyphosphate kinase n=1 Tax=unclassified Clostridium TaxID=2614128 RepID=UPI000E52164E|nr:MULTISPECIES: RNA degradosome polyphosphate kinase [unclassified Clostridium]RHV16611.1 RNA degradosome polyphosphate kinase [Clostridium sp. OM05-9BH]RHV20643.1 RNA degradosome polyphosphate kinase [Clostridium sp. OM05-6BH]
MSTKSPYSKPEYFYNRELSWLLFNRRVLEEAKDSSLPLFDRLKFLSITSSNLDEFFMIRVASLKDMVQVKYNKKDISGMTPAEQLAAINERTHLFVKDQYDIFNRSLIPALEKEGVHVLSHYENLSEKQSKYVDRYFTDEVYPVLTPMAVDSSRPFPLIRNKTLNIGAILRMKKDKAAGGQFRDLYLSHGNKKKGADSNDTDFATVQVPSVLPRFVEIPSEQKGEKTFILLEQIIEKNIGKLFVNYEIESVFPYRIMRNADLSIEEDEAADLLIEIERQLKKRQWGQAIRLEVEDGMDKRLLKKLRQELKIKEEDIFKINGPLDLTFLMKLSGLEGYDKLRTPKYTPQPAKWLNGEDHLFDQIRDHDVLLHHPYETFDPVVDFVKQASKDPNVLAIKQTLYRVSSHSPIIASLAAAAENGKQVTVLVELKARFDEENNIIWARKLEQAGCHVIYGLVGLKTHSKITLVVRKEEDGIRRYVHLGTGNYNDSTAKLYTDMGLLTCRKAIGEDATAVFNMLSGYSEPAFWNKLAIAPIRLRDRFTQLINREKEFAKKGKKAFIRAKMNSLCDAGIISSLYEAAAAGVKIELVVRGICCLKTGMPGISENITVRSIVGDFLEHSRIFHFYNNGFEEVYMGSADWMPRNLDKRVEILFPVEDDALKAEVIHILDIQLADNEKARILQKNGTYRRAAKGGHAKLNSQKYFCEEAKRAQKERKKQNKNTHTFEPLHSVPEE